MSRYIELPHAVHGKVNVFPRMGSSALGYYQLGLTLLIVFLLIGYQLDAYRAPIERTQTARLYPYAHEAQEMIAGYYMINGRWPTAIQGMFEPIEGPNPMAVAVTGRWAPYVQPMSGAAAPTGSALTHQGSFVITSNVRRGGSGELESLAFFLEQDSSDWPVVFRWVCGHRSAAAPQGLPDPTDLTDIARPRACTSP